MCGTRRNRNNESLLESTSLEGITRDVANACLFFATDESKFVTGIKMEVDGGKAIYRRQEQRL